MIEPLSMTFDVQCSAEHAFETWTARIGRWWPADHTVSGESDARVVLEGHTGGRLYERTATGAEHEWGEVIAWEPPRRLVYLWYLRRDRADATEVEINFIAQDAATTRVEIEHRGWERLGAQGADWRDANWGGWSTLLPHFTAAGAAAKLKGGVSFRRRGRVALEPAPKGTTRCPTASGTAFSMLI